MSERRHSLIAQLIRRLLAAGVGCVVLYFVLQSAARAGLLYYSEHSDIQERSIVREVERASLAAHGTTNPHCSDETLTLPDLVGWEEE